MNEQVPPICEHCHRSMRVNKVASSDNSTQFFCAWGHPVYYVNIHRVKQVNLKTGEKKVAQWPQ